MTDDEVSQILVQQRRRNGLMWYLEVAASADEQLDYQRTAPLVHVPNEMINQWEDWVSVDDLAWYGPPVFSGAEREAIRAFHEVWSETADATQNPMPNLEALIGTPVWLRFMAAADEALQVFSRRGHFSQDVEERFEA